MKTGSLSPKLIVNMKWPTFWDTVYIYVTRLIVRLEGNLSSLGRVHCSVLWCGRAPQKSGGDINFFRFARHFVPLHFQIASGATGC